MYLHDLVLVVFLRAYPSLEQSLPMGTYDLHRFQKYQRGRELLISFPTMSLLHLSSVPRPTLAVMEEVDWLDVEHLLLKQGVNSCQTVVPYCLGQA
jgi:hypothetical protein